ncbi:histidine phosphatase family protein, partial [Salmonella enterica]|uniref:histidine phosphatase family protein n=1 Tax=Salmonella enterica TaxID=28901 RepID=UPI003FA7E51B
FAQCGVRFDRVITSGLPRTVETAQRVLDGADLAALPIEVEPAWAEIRGGRLADLPAQDIEEAFLGAFRAGLGAENLRFLGGESIAELLDRVLPP